MKTVLIATLLTGWQMSMPPHAHAQSIAEKATKAAIKYAEDAATELARQGIQAELTSLITYFKQNNHEMNNPTAEFVRRFKACESRSQDGICDLRHLPQ